MKKPILVFSKLLLSVAAICLLLAQVNVIAQVDPRVQAVIERGDPVEIDSFIYHANEAREYVLASQAFTLAREEWVKGRRIINADAVSGAINTILYEDTFESYLMEREHKSRLMRYIKDLDRDKYAQIVEIFNWARVNDLVNARVVARFFVASVACGPQTIKEMHEVYKWAMQEWKTGKRLLNGDAIKVYAERWAFVNSDNPVGESLAMLKWAHSEGLIDDNGDPR